jgi:hypothetical protein
MSECDNLAEADIRLHETDLGFCLPSKLIFPEGVLRTNYQIITFSNCHIIKLFRIL